MDRATVLINATRELVIELQKLSFSLPITHTYNPLEYAWDAHKIYLECFANSRKNVLFMGMNPGPFGMAQTGVPFGEVEAVVRWMGISTRVGKPQNEHPKRPVQGFLCTKSEVSGRRLWGYFAEKFPKADDFFKNHYVTNYCPLVWMADTGRNITPDKVARDEMAPVIKACDAFLAVLLQQLRPAYLVGIGDFAEKKLAKVASSIDYDCVIGKVLHPSPASPAANLAWASTAESQLKDLGINF
jgi:single-strand selective monofunctional uracil DNA glycosylase